MDEKSGCLRERYRFRIAKCMRSSFYEFKECLGEGFEQKGEEYEVAYNPESDKKGLRTARQLKPQEPIPKVSGLETAAQEADKNPNH